MWLGMYIRQNGIIDKIKKISPWTIGIALVLVFMLANFESYYLFNHDHTNNNLNTLRINNQLYSLAIFAFLVILYIMKYNGVGTRCNDGTISESL